MQPRTSEKFARRALIAHWKLYLPASVAARLLNQAKQRGDDYQTLLTSFCLERFLYRLGESGLEERFVLKGVMLLRLWSDHPYRATAIEAIQAFTMVRNTQSGPGGKHPCTMSVQALPFGVATKTPAPHLKVLARDERRSGRPCRSVRGWNGRTAPFRARQVAHAAAQVFEPRYPGDLAGPRDAGGSSVGRRASKLRGASSRQVPRRKSHDLGAGASP